MLSALKRMIPAPMRQRIADAKASRIHGRMSYSQEGEDLLLMRLFDEMASGIYVDVGAHHPFRFSNTCLLHQRGWRGINIDARPGSMRLFRRFRPDDVNLEVGVDEQAKSLDFYVFAEPALNTFDERLATERRSQGWALDAKVKVECMPLATILDRHLSSLGAAAIDLLTVDAEGFDLQVLRSNDWQRFRPRAVVVEILDSDLGGVAQSPTTAFLASVGYRPSAKLCNSVVFLAAPAPSAQTDLPPKPALAR